MSGDQRYTELSHKLTNANKNVRDLKEKLKTFQQLKKELTEAKEAFDAVNDLFNSEQVEQLLAFFASENGKKFLKSLEIPTEASNSPPTV